MNKRRHSDDGSDKVRCDKSLWPLNILIYVDLSKRVVWLKYLVLFVKKIDIWECLIEKDNEVVERCKILGTDDKVFFNVNILRVTFIFI